MATYLRMPGLSADAEDAILIDWLVETGASLAKGHSASVTKPARSISSAAVNMM